MISFQHVSVTYSGAVAPVLRDVNLEVDEGQFALVAGRTGVGKSTLLGSVNGHVPHFTGGTLSGRVVVDGYDTRDYPPRELAHVVGVVSQDPITGFVTDTVEEELAYGMEQLGIAPDVMRTRVEDALDLLSIAGLRNRALRTLSGGQQQRVAIASVLTSGARVLVLDEPTSALDPTSTEEVLAALLRLVHDVGVTVLISEHRLERVIEYADQMILLTGDGGIRSGAPEEIMTDAPIAPPVVELGRLAGWEPLPLSIRDARRKVGPIRTELADLNPDTFQRPAPSETSVLAKPEHASTAAGDQGVSLVARGMSVAYGQLVAVRDVDFELPAGTITALMGRNGSGKSSLLWALTGVGPHFAGHWSVAEQDLSNASVHETRNFLKLVPQTATDLLYLDSVGAECAAADRQSHRPDGTCRAILDSLAPGIPADRHPRDLSEGQKLCLVVSVQLTSDPPVLLLDEPTRGLDYPAKQALGKALQDLASQGRAICVATHDVEFVAEIADRVVVMATGEVISQGSPRTVLTSSTTFSPQIGKIMAPQEWLTAWQVAAALGATR